MRWLFALLCTVSLAAAQAEMDVTIRLPAVLRFQFTAPPDLRMNLGEGSGDTLQVFINPHWQFLVSATTHHAKVYAWLEDEKAVRLSGYAQSLAEGSGGWQAVSLRYEPSLLETAAATVTYSLVHP
jgi:hypothetical protein